MKSAEMTKGGRYNWKHAPEDKLIYLGKFNAWHQFKKIGDPRHVWCEVLDGDLHMIEATPTVSCEPVDICAGSVILQVAAAYFEWGSSDSDWNWEQMVGACCEACDAPRGVESGAIEILNGVRNYLHEDRNRVIASWIVHGNLTL